ncbi:MAG: polysaccharide pyruvyl transferase family protein [Accumulibacter sp.]|jgi:polysaccharide pyruvyl transferase WcaK-like protein
MTKNCDKLNVYVVGWFGHKNSGDDALLVMTIDFLASVGVPVRPVLVVPSYGQLPPLPIRVDEKLRHRRYRVYTVLKAVLETLRSDVLFFGGGSVIGDLNLNMLGALYAKYLMCLAARIKGIPIIFSALGVGPLKTKRGMSLARKILNLADIVEARDANSVALCQELGVKTNIIRSFDPTVLFPIRYGQELNSESRKPEELPTIGIALSNALSSITLDKTSSERLLRLKSVIEALKDVATRQRFRVAVIQMCDDDKYGDSSLCKIISDSLSGACEVVQMPYLKNPIEMMFQFSKLKGVIAERLHAAIYAYTLGVRFAIMPSHVKTESFARDVGLDEKFIISTFSTRAEIMSAIKMLIEGDKACIPSLSVIQAQELAIVARKRMRELLCKKAGFS